MDPRNTPPYSSPTTPEKPRLSDAPKHSTVSTPQSITISPPQPTFNIPLNLTQSMVEANPDLKRLQQDLLILASFNDNSTLYWRPSWFKTPTVSSPFWTLHNPPHVVTESLPRQPFGRQVMTRRIRRYGDASPMYLRNQAAWERYCDMYGVPYDFLCEDQVRLLRLGLPRHGDGTLRVPPSWPLYPEPQPFAQGSYILDGSTHDNLPSRFCTVIDPTYGEGGECIVVYPDGALMVERSDGLQFAKCHGPGRRWSFLPWTVEQEKSCQPFKLKLRFWNTAMEQD